MSKNLFAVEREISQEVNLWSISKDWISINLNIR